MHYNLKTRQICLFMLAFLPVTKFFVLPSVLATTTKEDMWISTLILVLINAVVIYIITLACKKHDCDLYTLLENVFGKITSKIILLIYALLFLIKGVLPIIEQKSYIELTLFFTKFNILYFLPFFLFLFTFLIKQLRAVGRLSDIFWGVTVGGFILLFALAVKNADYSTLLPTFANGAGNIFKGSYLGASWFSDALYLIFFIGEFKFHKKSSAKIVGFYLISGLMVVLFMATFYATFSSIAFRQHFALTETTKYTNVINNIGRFDYLAIAMILCSGIISACLPLFFATKIICRVFNIEKTWIVSLTLSLAYFLLLTILSKYSYSISNFIIKYAGGGFVLFAFILPAFIVVLPKKEVTNAKKQLQN